MADLPSGTVTFLLTDIAGSTALRERDPEPMRRTIARRDAPLATIIGGRGGTVFGLAAERGRSRAAAWYPDGSR
jgi:class 3 adenylate cyclase